MINLCIATQNRQQQLERLLDGIEKPLVGVGILVLDQASTDETRDFLLTQHDVDYIFSKRNLGCAGARKFFVLLWKERWQKRIKAAVLDDQKRMSKQSVRTVINSLLTDDILVFLDDDCYIDPSRKRTWLSALTRPIIEHRADITGVDLRYMDSQGMSHTQLYPKSIPYVSGGRMAIGCRILLTPDMLDFDLRFNPNYYEDVDFCFQAASAKFRILGVGDIGLEHDLHVVSDAVVQASAVNRNKLLEKWGENLWNQVGMP